MLNKDFLKKFFKKNWINILIILSLIFLSFYFYRDIQKQVKNIELAKKELYNKEMSLLRAQTLESEWGKAEEYLKKLKELLPEEQDLIKFEDKIKSLKSENNIDLDFRFGSLNSLSNEPRSYNYALTISGEKELVLKTLEEFQKISPVIRLEQIEFKKISSNTKENTMNVEIKILGRVYIK
ncbi:MAG: hypothetical protein AB7D02_00585 [Candidatus Paceibacterota bacterium]